MCKRLFGFEGDLRGEKECTGFTAMCWYFDPRFTTAEQEIYNYFRSVGDRKSQKTVEKSWYSSLQTEQY